MIFLEISIVILLIVTNGILAMSELAIVSARKSRVRRLADLGDRRAATMLRLIEDPSRFLATVQVGITLVGVLAGAFGGATIADRVGDWLDTFPAIAPNGDAIGIGIVVIAITYLSIVIGELVPKRIALANPERVGTIVAPPMNLLSRLAAPVAWLLKTSTDTVLRLAGLSQVRDATVTEDEIKSLIAEGTRAGIFVPAEREMIEGVLRLADRSVRVIMTPRTEIIWLDRDAPPDAIGQVVSEGRVSRPLVCRGSVDHVIGCVDAKDLLARALKGETLDLRTAMIPVLMVPENVPVLKLLERFRRERLRVAVVVDEYGVTEGIVTLTDVLEAIAGEFPEKGEEFEPRIVRREDGSWLVDGSVPMDEVEYRLGLAGLSDRSRFDTLAGFVLHRLGRLPAAGESFEYRGITFEVVDMDRRRIDKVLVNPKIPGQSGGTGHA